MKNGELPSHGRMVHLNRVDPIEQGMEMLLTRYGIEYTRPEQDAGDPTTLDFYLPAFGLYIEVKQFHTDRIAGQLAKVPMMTTAIVLVGPTCINDFARLIENMRPVPHV